MSLTNRNNRMKRNNISLHSPVGRATAGVLAVSTDKKRAPMPQHQRAAPDSAQPADPACDSCPVRAFDLFREISDHRASTLLRGIGHLVYPPRSEVYARGDQSSFVYVVRSGLVKLSHFSPTGEERIVRILRSGETVGLEALFLDPHHCTATALIESRLCRVPVALLEQLEAEVPDFHRHLMREFQRSLSASEAVLTQLSTGPARGRVARLLVFLAHKEADGCVCTLISREDMGSILGITPESASRVVADLRRGGIVGRCEGGECTCNIDALRAIARGSEQSATNP
jgi:CRP/FNR family transcriptional regulator